MAGAAAGRGGDEPLSYRELAALAIKAGWNAGEASVAVAITPCESSRIPSAIQPGQPYATRGWGLWQITPGDSVPQYGINNAMLDPWNNARAAHYKWEKAGGWSPWTTYGNDCYASYLAPAEEAVQQVTHMSRAELDKLVEAARSDRGAAGPVDAGVHDWSKAIRASTGRVAHIALMHGDAAVAVAFMSPRFTPPKVVAPNPADILIIPGREHDT